MEPLCVLYHNSYIVFLDINKHFKKKKLRKGEREIEEEPLALKGVENKEITGVLIKKQIIKQTIKM